MEKFKRFLFTAFIFAYMLAQFESIKAEAIAMSMSEEVSAQTVVEEYQDEEDGKDELYLNADEAGKKEKAKRETERRDWKKVKKEEEPEDEANFAAGEALRLVTQKDIPQGEKGAAIRDMLARGILNGVSDTEFKGKEAITRAMVAEVLMRMSKDKSVGMIDFADIKGDEWYADSIAWAVTHGIYQGYPSGEFKPNQKLTRQEFASIMYRYLEGEGVKMPEVKDFDYKDASSIASWSKEAVMKLDKQGLVTGKSEDIYDANSDYLREDLALTLSKIVNYMMKDNNK